MTLYERHTLAGVRNPDCAVCNFRPCVWAVNEVRASDLMPGPINWYDAYRAVSTRIEPGVGGRWLELYDEAGNEVGPGGGGYLVIRQPWPAMPTTQAAAKVR